MLTTIKKNYKLIIKIILVLVIIVCLVSKIDINSCIELIKKFPISMLIIILFLFLLQFIILGLKWQTLLPNINLGILIRNILYGHAMTYAVGGQLVGESIKALSLGKKEKDYSLISASVIMDKIIGLISSFIVGAAGILFSNIMFPSYLIILYFLVSLFLVSVLFLIGKKKIQEIFDFFLNKLKKKCGESNKIVNFIGSMLNACERFATNYKCILWNLLYGVLYQILAVSISYTICFSLGISISFFDLCWIMAAVSIVGLIPISFAGFGVNQVSSIGLMEIAGAGSSAAFSYTIVLYMFSVFIAIIGAGFYLVCERKSD